jgi:hypothetical protein
MGREAKSGVSFQLAVRTASSPGAPMPQSCGIEILERVDFGCGNVRGRCERIQDGPSQGARFQLAVRTACSKSEA